MMAETGFVSILLVDDHAVVRQGYRRLLERTPNLKVTAEASSAEEAYRLYSESPVDVVVMDINMPGMTGIEATRRLCTRFERVKVLMFSMHEEEMVAFRALQAGARGYVTKSSAPDVLVDAVLAIANNGVYINHELAQRLAMHNVPGRRDALAGLSPKEFEVFRLSAHGLNVEGISAQLCLSHKTVANYQSLIRSKLRITNDAQWVQLALRHGVLDSHSMEGAEAALSGSKLDADVRVSADPFETRQ